MENPEPDAHTVAKIKALDEARAAIEKEDECGEPAAPAVPIGDQYLDMKQARAELHRLGIYVTDRKMREIVRERRLPFFKSVDSRLRIGRRILHRCIEERQEAASREFERPAAQSKPNQGET